MTQDVCFYVTCCISLPLGDIYRLDSMVEEVEREFYDEDEDDISELSSSPSIPEGDIDFNFVYALHTFLATVEGGIRSSAIASWSLCA